MNGTWGGLVYKDQEAAEMSVSRWRWRYAEAIRELEELNGRMDSLALSKQIDAMKAEAGKW